MTTEKNEGAGGASLSDAGLAMQPASRENKTPLAADAPIREYMHGLCKSCAYASDLCAGQHRRQKGTTFGGVTECGGYSRANDALRGRASAACEGPLEGIVMRKEEEC